MCRTAFRYESPAICLGMADSKPALPTGFAREAVATLGRWIVNDRFAPAVAMPTEPELAVALGCQPGDRSRRDQGLVRQGACPHRAPLRHPCHPGRILEPARWRRDRLARAGASPDAPDLRRDYGAPQPSWNRRRPRSPRSGRPRPERGDPLRRLRHATRIGRRAGALRRRLPLPRDDPRRDAEPGHAAAASDHPDDAARLLRVRRHASGERSGDPRGAHYRRRGDRPTAMAPPPGTQWRRCCAETRA